VFRKKEGIMAEETQPSTEKRLFVGNISYSTTEDNLKTAFGAFGTVESAQIVTMHDGRSKGFGFVEMASVEEANAAVEGLNGKDMDGRPLTVNIARPRKERSDRDDRPRYNRAA
jgi:cold-inducible RNA-binding protein